MSTAGDHAAAGVSRARDRALALVLGAALVLTVALVYARTARHEFVSYDDGLYVTEDARVAGGLTWANARAAFAGFHGGNWHPLTTLSHQLDVTLFGLAPGPHHLVSVALHALNAVLCFVFFRRTTGATWASVLVAALFALHPLRVESVAWAAERKDVLSGAFFFLVLLAHARFAERPSPGRRVWVAVALALGLLAKPMLVTAPLVLLLCDAWPLRRLPAGAGARAWLPLVREKAPLLALAAASAVVTLVAQRAGGAVKPLELLSLPERLAGAVLGPAAYLAKSAWPAGLAVFYPHPALVPGAELAAGRSAATAFVFVLVTLAAWRVRARLPQLLVGWTWMWTMLLPVLGLVQVGLQLCADRYTYLPLLGPVFALVFGARALLGPRARAAGVVLGLAAVALLAWRSARQVEVWRDSRTLFEHALAVTRGNFVAHEHLGLHFQAAGDLARAEEHYLAALELLPVHSGSLGNLGAVQVEEGRLAEARATFERVAAERPGDVQALLGLATVALREGKPEEAVRLLAPVPPETDGYALVLLNLGEAYALLQDWPRALDCYERSFAFGPPDPQAAAVAAWIHATGPDEALLDGDAAVAMASYAAENGVEVSEVLAAAHARRGEFADAARWQEQAVARQADPVQRFVQEQRLRLYRAGKAYTRPR